MAKVVSTAYVDDLDGSEASGPVDFSLDGKDYTIDLSDSNAARLRDALASFIASARRAGGSGRRQISSPQRSASGRSREETQEIRSVLRELGYEVKDRGRVSSDLLAAYETRTPAPGKSSDEQPKAKRSRKKTTDRGTEANENIVEFRSA
jgi:hypothetical protein